MALFPGFGNGVENGEGGDDWLDMSGVVLPTWIDSSYGSTEKDTSSNFIADGIRRLLRQELANPETKRKQGSVIFRDPADPSVSVNLDDLVPGYMGGYKEPLVSREYRVRSNKAAKSPLGRREYRESAVKREKKIGGIDESKLMIAKLRAALLAVSEGGRR